MTEESDLLAAILANPADDNVRLVYADWLDERADSPPCPRAEFIRVQCELARTPAHLGVGTPLYHDVRTDFYGPMPLDRVLVGFSEGIVPNPRHVELSERERGLWTMSLGWAHPYVELSERERGLWTMSLGWAHPYVGARSWFSRGFMSAVTCTAADWLTHGDRIVAAHPIEKVALTTLPPLAADEDECWFHRDPAKKRFAHTDVRTEWRESDPERDSGVGIIIPLLRLRYGRGIEFTVPEFAYPWQDDLPPVTQPVDSVPPPVPVPV